MEITVKNGIATITFPLNGEATESASGKTMLVASTYGAQVIGLDEAGRPVSLSLNAYYPVKAGRTK